MTFRGGRDEEKKYAKACQIQLGLLRYRQTLQTSRNPELELMHKYTFAFKSPFEKGGQRGICFATAWENPPSPPFTKGGILFTDKL